MRLTHSRSGRQSAFTLIELLVVMAIITVLVALLAAGVMGALGAGQTARAKTEIMQLEMAVNAAKADYGVKYLPSRIVLREDNAYNLANPDHAFTVKFLQQMFPKIDLTSATGIDWNGNGKIDKGVDLILLADQTLVFFLGGIPSPGTSNACLGFSTDPRNPAAPGGTRTRTNFDFNGLRLQVSNTNGFFRYVDQWGTNSPYLYFSTYGSENSYRANECPPGLKIMMPKNSPPTPPPAVVTPYMLSANPAHFVNPNSFQIISAGKDGLFGWGGLWDPTTGLYPTSGTPYVLSTTLDDQDNFGSGSVIAAGAK
jgi:prepilin-type N-terminal cleavage/methylation domain-containing protein